MNEIIYKSILENMKDGVMTVGSDGRIMTFNAAAEAILNFKKEEVLQRSFGEVFLLREGNDDFNQTILNAVYESEKVHNSIVKYNTGDRMLVLAVTTSFLHSLYAGEAQEKSVIVVFNDITEMERLVDAEVHLTEELKKRHMELQRSYVQLEEANSTLKAVLKKVQVARMMATVFVILLFLSVGLYVWKGAVRFPVLYKSQQPASTLYKVAYGNLSESISLKGILKPAKLVNITSPFNGAVESRHFEYGDRVKKGDLLLKLDSADMQVKHREASIAFIKAKEKLREIENWEKGDEVAKMKRSISKAKLNLDSQKKTMDETEYLFKKGIVPATEYESAKQQYANSKMDYEAALAEMKTVMAKGTGYNLKIANYEFENARQTLRDIEQDLSNVNVYAPVSGTIILAEAGQEGEKAKTADRGVQFARGEKLLSIGDTEGYAVNTSVDETEVVKLREGLAAKIRGDAFPGVLSGEVVSISSQAKSPEDGKMNVSFSLTVHIKDIPAEAKEKIRLGMSVVMDISIFDKPNALLVPVSAVHIEEGRRYVMVKDKSTGELNKVKVETGITTVDSVEILSGLKAGDEIMR